MTGSTRCACWRRLEALDPPPEYELAFVEDDCLYSEDSRRAPSARAAAQSTKGPALSHVLERANFRGPQAAVVGRTASRSALRGRRARLTSNMLDVSGQHYGVGVRTAPHAGRTAPRRRRPDFRDVLQRHALPGSRAPSDEQRSSGRISSPAYAPIDGASAPASSRYAAPAHAADLLRRHALYRAALRPRR